jgi:hypothetical protein
MEGFTQIHKAQERISIEDIGINPPERNQDLLQMRLNNDGFIYNLWRTLAGRTPKKIDGKHYLVQMKYVTPPMNDQGALEITNMLRFLNNPSVVLGRVSYEEARAECEGLLESLSKTLVDKEEEWGITNPTAKEHIMSQLLIVIWNQLSRPIDGQESLNLITTVQKQEASSDVKETINANSGGKWYKGGGVGQ